MEFIDPKKKNKSPKFFEEGDKKVETIYDDPEWRELRDKVKKQSEKDIERNKLSFFDDASEPYDKDEKKEKKQVEVNIKLSLPKTSWDKLKKYKDKIKDLKSGFSLEIFKQPRTYFIIGALILVCGLLSLIFLNKNKNSNKASNNQSSTEQVKEEPISHDVPFSAVLPPSGIDKEDISYNPERNFAKFDDSIDGVLINVSQQTLPENFKSDKEGSLDQLAKDFEVTKTIQTGSGLAYIKETEQGPETIIFTKFDLLIFIRTQNKVSETSVIKYIDNLN